MFQHNKVDVDKVVQSTKSCEFAEMNKKSKLEFFFKKTQFDRNRRTLVREWSHFSFFGRRHGECQYMFDKYGTHTKNGEFSPTNFCTFLRINFANESVNYCKWVDKTLGMSGKYQGFTEKGFFNPVSVQKFNSTRTSCDSYYFFYKCKKNGCNLFEQIEG